MPDYKIGNVPPALNPDAGAGWTTTWCMDTPPTMEAIAFKNYIERHLSGAAFALGFNAEKHMRHYLLGNGQDLHVDMGELVKKSDALFGNYLNELNYASEFAQTLPPGEYAIVSTELKSGKFVKIDSNKWGINNLYYASGDYKFWGQADVKIKQLNDDKNTIDMVFWFHFFDRYNWDIEKDTDVAGNPITDKQMGELHRQCLAKEFDLKGLIERKVTLSYKVDRSKLQKDAKQTALTGAPPVKFRDKNVRSSLGSGPDKLLN